MCDCRNILNRHEQMSSGYKKGSFQNYENCLSEWCHQESNRGHKDFQSFALPTEL